MAVPSNVAVPRPEHNTEITLQTRCSSKQGVFTQRSITDTVLIKTGSIYTKITLQTLCSSKQGVFTQRSHYKHCAH